MTAEEFIRKYADENKIDNIGICNADNFEEIRSDLEKNAEILKGFVERNIEKRINVRLTMENAKSIICIAQGFNIKYDIERDDEIRSYISMGAIGEDYHIYIKKILEELAEEMKEKFGGEYLCFSDTGPLSDRSVAIRSGVGYRGKNGCIIAKNGGAAVFIGYIITSLKLETSKTNEESCGECRRCILSCPSGAITENGFETEKCISYLTQVKRELSLEEMKTIGYNLYGCDVCQRVCRKTGYAEKICTDIDECMPKTEEILNLSQREFKERYGKTAMGWRGAAVIKRNALCSLMKYRNKKAYEIAVTATKSESHIVKKTAEKVIDFLETAQEK